MSNANDVRNAHHILDELDARAELSQEQEKLLRSFLPELPAQMTLEEITGHVRNAWVGASGNSWAGNSYDTEITIEGWLRELYVQLAGVTDVKPVHPEFLETEADYTAAPEGTIVASAKASPAMKSHEVWESAPYVDREAKAMAGESRRVLRWGK